MKVQLIVVKGKPEGMIIPLRGPIFRIGRGENCQLRPNSEQISREHAELSITSGEVMVRDLGSRNGTFVNNWALTGPIALNNGDLIEVGVLTFAISIEGAAVQGSATAADRQRARAAGSDEISSDDIESWLVADESSPTPDHPSTIYGGETRTMDARGLGTPTGPGDPDVADDSGPGSGASPDAEGSVDESNPFLVKRPTPPAQPARKDSCDAASEILMKMMEHRRIARHSVR